jgi:hypothetical protein
MININKKKYPEARRRRRTFYATNEQWVQANNFKIPPIPTGLTSVLISGGVKYDWTAGDVLAQTEVWCRSDSDAYTTVTYTINAGIVTKSETINPVDLRYCKIRALKGGSYSAFTAEVSIAMLSEEIVINGDFNSTTGWTIETGWTIGSGKAIWDSSQNSGSIHRSATITSGHKYKITVNLFDISGGDGSTCVLPFCDASYNGVFPAPFLYDFYHVSSYNFVNYLTAAFSSNIIKWIAYGGANNKAGFSLSNMSVKEILFP